MSRMNFARLANDNFTRMQGAPSEPQRPDSSRSFSNDIEEILYKVNEMYYRQRPMFDAMRNCSVGLTQLATVINNLGAAADKKAMKDSPILGSPLTTLLG